MSSSLGKGRISNQDWKLFRGLVDELKKDYGQSWTDISTAAKKERGWAANAYRRKTLVSPHDIVVLEKLRDHLLDKATQPQPQPSEAPIAQEEVPPQAATAEAPEALAGESPRETTPTAATTEESLNEKERREVVQLIQEARNQMKLSWKQIDQMFGYAVNAGGSRYALSSQGKIGRDKYLRMRSEMARLRQNPQAIEPQGFQRGEDSRKITAESRTTTRKADSGSSKREALTPSRASEDTLRDTFAWVDEVRDQLFAIAARIEDEAATAPPLLRGPYIGMREKVLDLMAQFTR